MLEKFLKQRNLEKRTEQKYRTLASKYAEFHEMELDELLKEAITEERENTVDVTQRKISDRIFSFRDYLIDFTDNVEGTINQKIINICAIYKFYGLTIPQITPLKDRLPQITYYDIPNKEHIALAIESTSIENQALILFMCSSGTARTEVISLTIKDFIDATSEYHQDGTIEEIVDTLFKTQEILVPTFYIYRQKTNKWYWTFCTPEASFAILRMLKLRIKVLENKGEKLKLEDSLFNMTTRSITDKFQYINDKLHFGFKRKYRFFRPHTLRKFHASNLNIAKQYIHDLQGRSQEKITETYIKPNPKELKKIYMHAMDNVTIAAEKQRTVINKEYHIHNHIHFHSDMGVDI